MNICIYTEKSPAEDGFYYSSAKLRDETSHDAVYNFKIDVNEYAAELRPHAAELIAIQHVLFHPEAYYGLTLKTVTITTSSGQVKKALQDRANDLLNQLAAPTRYRTEAMILSVNNTKPQWFSTSKQKTLINGAIYTNTHFSAITSFGLVEITSSTINNYRTEQKSVGCAHAELIRELQKSITKLKTTSKAMKRKLAKYGSKALDTINFKTQSGRHVFVLDTRNNVLITCYAK